MYEVLFTKIQEAKFDIIVCGYDVNSDKKIAEWKPVEMVCDHNYSLTSLIDGRINNNVWNKLYSKELLQKSRINGVLFPESKNYEDVAVMHRIIDKAKSVAIKSEVLYHYRIRSGSITKNYTVKNLMDYADARLDRYYYFRNEYPELYKGKKDKLSLFAVYGIYEVWRWWYGCKVEEKQGYINKINELLTFVKDNIPLFGYSSWPNYMRLSVLFLHSSSNLIFFILYALNQAFRKLWPEKA